MLTERLNNLSNAMRPQNISLGGWIQQWAIEKNKEPRLWGLKKIQARLGAVIAKPAARIIDVALHVGLGVTKCAVGVTIKPIRWVISKIKDEQLETNFSVTQGIHHLGLAVLYAVDCPVSIAINLLSPGIYEHMNNGWNKLFHNQQPADNNDNPPVIENNNADGNVNNNEVDETDNTNETEQSDNETETDINDNGANEFENKPLPELPQDDE